MKRISTRAALGILGAATAVLGVIALRPDPQPMPRPPAIIASDAMPVHSGFWEGCDVLAATAPGGLDHVLIWLWRYDAEGERILVPIVLVYDGRTILLPHQGQAVMIYQDEGGYAGWLPCEGAGTDETDEGMIEEWRQRWLP